MDTNQYLYVAEVFANDYQEFTYVFRSINTDEAEIEVKKEIDEYFLSESKKTKRITYKIYKFGQANDCEVVDGEFTSLIYKDKRKDFKFKFEDGKITVEMTSELRPGLRFFDTLREDQCIELFNVMSRYYAQIK